MEVPFKLTSYLLQPLLIVVGSKTLKYAKKYIIPWQGQYADAHLNIYLNKSVKGGGLHEHSLDSLHYNFTQNAS